MTPIQLDLLTPAGQRWQMEWLSAGSWLPEFVEDSLDQAISQGRLRMRSIPWETWRVRPYIAQAADDDATYSGRFMRDSAAQETHG